jgi:hypothetical protein
MALHACMAMEKTKKSRDKPVKSLLMLEMRTEFLFFVA